MKSRIPRNLKVAYFALIGAQVLHAVEEYFTGFADAFSFTNAWSKSTGIPARVICNWIDVVFVLVWLSLGFLVLKNRARVAILVFAVVQLYQAMAAHVGWSVQAMGYSPGLITSVFLLIPISCYMIVKYIRLHE